MNLEKISNLRNSPHFGLFLAVFMTALIQGVLSVMALFLSFKNYPTEDIANLIALFGLGGIVGGIIGGKTMDYLPPKPVLITLALLFMLPISLLYFGQETMVFMALFCLGFIMAFLRSAYFTLFLGLFHKETALNEALANRRFFLNVGIAIGSALAGLILNIVPSSLLIFLLLLTFGLMACIFFLPTPSIQEGAHTSKAPVQHSKTPFWLLVMSLFLILIPFALVPNLNLLFLEKVKSLNPAQISTIFLINGLMIALLQIPLIKRTNAVALDHKILVGAGLMTLGICAVFFTTALWQVYALTILWTLGEILLFVPYVTKLKKITPYRNGTTTSIYQLCFSGTDFLAPLMGGILVAYSYGALWLVVFAIACIGLWLFYTTSLKRKDL